MEDVFHAYGGGQGYDEMFDRDVAVRPVCDSVFAAFAKMPTQEILARAKSLAATYLDQGVTFGVGGEERPFPLDIVPRLIDANRWRVVEAGVRQRVRALEAFLDDIYAGGAVLTYGVIPRSIVVTSPHYHRVVTGFAPPTGCGSTLLGSI